MFWGGIGEGVQTLQNWKSIFATTRVGFGRTEVSLSAIGKTFCVISLRHGPRGQGFEGFSKTLDFMIFVGGSKMQKT